MKVKEIIKKSKLPNLETETLLAFILKKTREYIIIHQEENLNLKDAQKFFSMEKKRALNLPLAYLTGNKEFYNLNFKVNKNVLVPRPETEILIDTILTRLKTSKNNYDFLDVGTGSGVIIISLAHEIFKHNKTIFNNSSFLGVDISEPALKIAKQNAKTYNLNTKIAFFKSDLLKSLPTKALKDSHLVIAANLPYLTKKQLENEPSIKHEPSLALDGGPKGLEYYHRLLKELKKINFKSLFLILEINPEQAIAIKKVAQKTWSQATLKIIKDLRKQSRFLTISLN